MSSGVGPEGPTVQFPMVRYAVQIGWTELSREEAILLRRGESGTLLFPILRRQLLLLNPGVLNDENVDAVIARLDAVRADIEGNAEVLAWLRGERTVKLAVEKRDRNVVLIDFEHPERNLFHVTCEWSFTNGQHTHRADVMFLINGVPVALVETKAQGKKGALDQGLKQVGIYHRETPEMLAAPQIFDVNELLDFWYGATWNLDRKSIFNWRDEEPGNFEHKVKRFFDRGRFLEVLREHILFFKKDDELRKIVLRQHQTRAVDRVVQRAFDSGKQRGLVWHTQGSGKTFTMIKAAERILREGTGRGDKPTVVMLVDRNELETQLFDNLAAYGLSAVQATSKMRLRDLLRADTRGLIVSMIHKFDKADADLCTRGNVVVLVDEAHRTTGGTLGHYLVATLPKATFIGFSGTPIDRTAHGEGTFKIFGKDDAPKGYLDKYSMRESIDDGTTLPLRYTLAPNDIRVPREQLEKEFLGLAETEGLADIEDLNRILDRAVNLKNFLKAKDRVDKVARFVAEHFKSNVDPLGFKAFLVGVDREACALYKRALDRYLPAEWSEVVYTKAQNDEPPISDFHHSDDDEKKIRKVFAKPGLLPKILIVTEKLLTGYDAPILYCMYLDKPMRDHTLLQAIARVNRPYATEEGKRKPVGFVVDFVGIFQKLEKALSFDSDEVESVIEHIDVLKDKFGELMAKDAKPCLALCRGHLDDKGMERILDAFAEREPREKFFDFFKELQELYEIISPDVFLRPFIKDYERLAEMCDRVANSFGRRLVGYQQLAEKTGQLVREHVTSWGLTETLPLTTIDETVLDALKEKGAGKPGKIMNLAKSIGESLRANQEELPYLIPIGDRVDAVLERYDDRQISTQEALGELEKVVRELSEARRQQTESGFDSGTFTIYRELQREQVASAGELAGDLDAAFRRNANFRESDAAMRVLKADMYKVLLKTVGKERMVDVADRLLRLWKPSLK